MIKYKSVLLLLLASLLDKSQAKKSDVIWATSGGGWRAMAGSMAFANVYSQAGLLTETSSNFTVVSSTSGGSWFSTQFFFSPVFHSAMMKSPQNVSAFFVAWMGTYKSMTTSSVDNNRALCNVFDVLPNNEYGENICRLFLTLLDFDDAWIKFIQKMLQGASSEYGDENLINTELRGTNRLAAMQNTSLSIMNVLSPVLRTRYWLGWNDYCTYFGKDQVYNVILPAPFLVSTQKSGWQLNYIMNSTSYLDKCSNKMNYDDWTVYFKPSETGKTTIEYLPPKSMKVTSALKQPFSNYQQPLLFQIAAASSAAAAWISPITSAPFAQGFYLMNVSDWIASPIYRTLDGLDGAAVCSQYPIEDCDENDALLMDGGFIDNPALVTGISTYQEQNSFEATETPLKVLVNVHNQGQAPDWDYPQVLAYFNTSFNKQVAPGGYLHVPGYYVPQPSLQIFEESLEQQELIDSLESINGTNITYLLIKATTIDNPVYQVKAGQSVELMLLFLNNYVTTYIFGTDRIDADTPILADMITKIGSSTALIDLIKNFVA